MKARGPPSKLWNSKNFSIMILTKCCLGVFVFQRLQSCSNSQIQCVRMNFYTWSSPRSPPGVSLTRGISVPSVDLVLTRSAWVDLEYVEDQVSDLSLFCVPLEDRGQVILSEHKFESLCQRLILYHLLPVSSCFLSIPLSHLTTDCSTLRLQVRTTSWLASCHSKG